MLFSGFLPPVIVLVFFTHTVFPELFMLACHILACSFPVFIHLSAPVCLCPGPFLPSISSLPSLARLPPRAVGLAVSIHTASSFHPFSPSSFLAQCWSQGIQTYTLWPAVPLEGDSYLHLFLSFWLKTNQDFVFRAFSYCLVACKASYRKDGPFILRTCM